MTLRRWTGALAGVGALVLLLLLILVLKLHAFFSLLLVSMVLGLGSGMAPARVLKSMQTGFGDALGFIAVVVALGAVIGRMLEHSGGGRALADWLLAKTGPKHAVWAVFFAALLIGLPIFFEVGFIILIPLVYSLTRESGRSLLYFGLPAAAALARVLAGARGWGWRWAPRAPWASANSTIWATSRRGMRSVTMTTSRMPFSIASKTASLVKAGGTVTTEP